MKANKSLLYAIQSYYFNRHRQYKYTYVPEAGVYIGVVRKDSKWDKDGDLDNIGVEAKKQKLGFFAISGTFWFTRQLKKGKVARYTTNETMFPNFVREK